MKLATNVAPPPAAAPARGWRSAYLSVLLWAFVTFNVLRLLTYLPMLWAIHTSARADQHSLLTWVGWTLSNLTMALWLHERSPHRLDGAVLLNFGNAAMCAIASLLIAWYR